MRYVVNLYRQDIVWIGIAIVEAKEPLMAVAHAFVLNFDNFPKLGKLVPKEAPKSASEALGYITNPYTGIFDYVRVLGEPDAYQRKPHEEEGEISLTELTAYVSPFNKILTNIEHGL